MSSSHAVRGPRGVGAPAGGAAGKPEPWTKERAARAQQLGRFAKKAKGSTKMYCSQCDWFGWKREGAKVCAKCVDRLVSVPPWERPEREGAVPATPQQQGVLAVIQAHGGGLAPELVSSLRAAIGLPVPPAPKPPPAVSPGQAHREAEWKHEQAEGAFTNAARKLGHAEKHYRKALEDALLASEETADAS